MSKLSIFTIFLTVAIIVVMADISVNKYLKSPYGRSEVKSDVLDVAQNETSNAKILASPMHTRGQNEVAKPATSSGSDMAANIFGAEDSFPSAKSAAPSENIPDVADNVSSGTIDFAMIKNSGFTNGETLQKVPFNGVLFESMDLRDFNSVPILQSNMLRNNREKTAVFYQFMAEDGPLAKEIYRFLKEKSGTIMGATVNETNSFGTGSFYINFLSRPESVFLVVKQKENVYALAYLKEIHPLIKKLITSLI